MDSDLKFTSLK